MAVLKTGEHILLYDDRKNSWGTCHVCGRIDKQMQLRFKMSVHEAGGLCHRNAGCSCS